jgi:hypothetical protein
VTGQRSERKDRGRPLAAGKVRSVKRTGKNRPAKLIAKRPKDCSVSGFLRAKSAQNLQASPKTVRARANVKTTASAKKLNAAHLECGDITSHTIEAFLAFQTSPHEIRAEKNILKNILKKYTKKYTEKNILQKLIAQDQQ